MADEQPKPVIDAFGEPRDAEGKIVSPEPPKAEEKAPVAAADKPKTEEAAKPAVDDIEKHPVVTALKEQIADVKKSMGGNLSEQRKIIERLEKDLKDARAGKKPSVEPLFKDIKRVKDLPKADQEAMTDTEKRLFDELADTHVRMNEQHAAMQADKAKAEDERQAADEQTQKAEDAKKATDAFNKKAQAAAKKLAGDDTGLANKIVENFNLFRDNESLDDDGIAERMEAAARMIPECKPPQQKSPTGNNGTAVKAGTQADPFGVYEFIKQAKGGTGGKYQL